MGCPSGGRPNVIGVMRPPFARGRPHPVMNAVMLAEGQEDEAAAYLASLTEKVLESDEYVERLREVAPSTTRCSRRSLTGWRSPRLRSRSSRSPATRSRSRAPPNALTRTLASSPLYLDQLPIRESHVWSECTALPPRR